MYYEVGLYNQSVVVHIYMLEKWTRQDITWTAHVWTSRLKRWLSVALENCSHSKLVCVFVVYESKKIKKSVAHWIIYRCTKLNKKLKVRDMTVTAGTITSRN